MKVEPAFPTLLLRQQMSEDEFQDWVTDIATARGWSWHHEQDSRKSKAGFLDLFMWHPKRAQLIFAELKREKDYRVSKAQQRTLDELGTIAVTLARLAQFTTYPKPVQVFLWRPSDMEQIWKVLQ